MVEQLGMHNVMSCPLRGPFFETIVALCVQAKTTQNAQMKRVKESGKLLKQSGQVIE